MSAIFAAFAKANAGAAEPAEFRLRHPQARRQGHHRDDPGCPQGHPPSYHPGGGRSDSVVYTNSYPAMKSSTSPSSITTGSTIRTPTFSIATITSMESRTSGTRPSARSAVTTAFRKSTFPSLLKEAECRFNFGTPRPSNAEGLANPIWDKPFPICSFTGTTGAHWRQILTNFQSVRVGAAHDDREASVFPPTPSKVGLSADPLQIIQKRLRTTTFGLQIFLDSVF